MELFFKIRTLNQLPFSFIWTSWMCPASLTIGIQMSVIGHVDSAGSPYQSGRAQSSAPVAYTMPPATNEKLPTASRVNKGTDSKPSQSWVFRTRRRMCTLSTWRPRPWSRWRGARAGSLSATSGTTTPSTLSSWRALLPNWDLEDKEDTALLTHSAHDIYLTKMLAEF